MSYGIMPARGRGWPFPESHLDVDPGGGAVNLQSPKGEYSCVGLAVSCDTTGNVQVTDAGGNVAVYKFYDNTFTYLPGHFRIANGGVSTFAGIIVAHFATP